jgi:hypothetical protein
MFKELQEEIAKLKARNARVESDKAWEQSWARTAAILVVTYVIAGSVLYTIGNDNPLRNALIPVVGFFLSIQSFPFLKSRWVARYEKA